MTMDGMLRRAGLLLVFVLFLGLAVQPAAVLAQGGGPNQVDVSGFSFPVVELGEEFFPDAGPNQIGDRGALGYISPFVADPSDPSSAPITNGFVGYTVIQERVVRILANDADPHKFTFKSEQIITSGGLTPPGFSGVVIDRTLIPGSFTQSLQGTGTLQDTCAADPDPQDIGDDENPDCAAATFVGTWSIAGNSGSGELAGLRGNGTFEWLGCIDYSDPTTCSLPTYEGTIRFARGAESASAGAPFVVLTSSGTVAILDADPVFLPALSQ